MNNISTEKKLFFFKTSVFIFLTFIFFLKGIIFLDPDFGWHIRYGEIILSSGLLKTDPFSYTMPSYQYANHEWIADIIFAKLYPVIGLEGLSLIFAVIASITIFLIVPKPLKGRQMSVVFLTSTIFLSFTGIRPQIISWLFFVIVLKVIQSKRLVFLPFIFLLWANIHGSFMIGFIPIFIYISSKIISERKIPIRDIYIFILSVAVTLINPYQLKLWQEIWTSVSDPMLRRAIEEWYPILFAPHPLIVIWLLLSAFLLIKYRLHLTLFEKIFYIPLFLAAFSSIRNTPFFILATLPFVITFLTQYIEGLKRRLPDILYSKLHISISLFFLTVLLLTISLIFNPSNMETYAYPQDAVSFLKKQRIEGEVFAPYNWGGYLIWQYPQKKVFIDGRMPSWRQNSKVEESKFALGEYFKVFSSPSELDKIFNKYHINTVLWPNTSKKTSTFGEKILLSWQNSFIINYSSSDFIKMLQNLGWKKIYMDDVAVIYHK